MSIGEIFWILMVIWLVFGLWGTWQLRQPAPGVPAYYWMHGNTIFLFVLLFLLGWHSFGFMIRGQ